MPERLVTIATTKTNLYDTEMKVNQQYSDKAWQEVAHIGRYWDSTECHNGQVVIKHKQNGQTTHLQWLGILAYHSLCMTVRELS